jgi:hypothetical protein
MYIVAMGVYREFGQFAEDVGLGLVNRHGRRKNDLSQEGRPPWKSGDAQLNIGTIGHSFTFQMSALFFVQGSQLTAQAAFFAKPSVRQAAKVAVQVVP